ncbi:carbohydrate-binding protein [Aureimonas sp. ME7]|uniref:carbohydrate-binding protein n=1 Tax=Aureimonas sp. ME7 TaxID=2744252 RepID=UPI0015F611C7|nr:carbohydrate-binding protein [Aureimonas sp. ME7]
MTASPPDWFRNPEPRFRTATFWFWHRIPTQAEIAAQLADISEKGIGCVMIQARPALDLSVYLSPAYLAAYRTACQTAKRLGIGVTIYDEYGWMSGHGGGRTVAVADALRERHLFWASGPVGAPLGITGIRSPFLDFLGEAGRSWIYDGSLPVWGDWQTVAAIAHPPVVRDEGALRILEDVDIDPQGNDGCRIALADIKGVSADWRVTVFVSARCLTSRLVNYLLPETAERFADTVYAPLVDAADGAADAIFFDHPYAGFYIWNEHEGALGNSLLSDGQPAGPGDAMALLSLARDVGPATPMLRAGFLKAYGERMHEAFFGTLSRWARKRGLGFTGHELLTHVGGWSLHGGLTGMDPRTMPGVDYFGIDAFRTQTAVDAADFAPQLAAKLGDSVARANGRRRCTIEQYATGRERGRPTLAGQWDLTPQRFRTQAIRHLLLGARRILLHAVNVTDGFDGDERPLLNPRWDFPPAYNFQPWWDDCPAIFSELARLSAFLEDGDPLRPVALFYPLETIRAEGPAHACGEHFGRWAEALARAGIGYDVVDERMLGTALAPGGGYETLVLPAATRMRNARSVDLIGEFGARGGRILASGQILRSVRERVGNLDPIGRRDRAHLSFSEIAADEIEACVAALPRPRPDIRFRGDGPTWSSIARCGDTWRIAVLNDADHAREMVLASNAAEGEIAIWSPAEGESEEPTVAAARPGELTLQLPAHGVACLTVPDDAHCRPLKTSGIASPPRICAAAGASAVMELADGWTLGIGDLPPVPVAVDRGWEKQGFPVFSGTGTYRNEVRIPDRPENAAWSLALPGFHASAEVWIDDRLIGRALGGSATFSLPYSTGARLALTIRVRNTAANRYYRDTSFGEGFPEASGLTAPPQLLATPTPGG